MSLAEYRRKRRFDKTREPEPGKRAPAGERAVFVVQLHHASHRHYDFRLQVGDALKSWAVPKGPSLDPHVKRLAAEVEDHPVDYATFEGEIPKGQYGAGHVAIFDHGVWATADDVQAQLAKGHLKFELFGERLKGGWHLVRSHRPSRRPEWLLIKQQDEYAASMEADDLLNGANPVADAATEKIRLPRARIKQSAWHVKASALRGSRPADLEPDAIAFELARLVETPPEGEQWLHEPKWDGYRILALIEDGEVSLWSRNRLDWTGKLPEVAAALKELGLRNAALDGELIAGQGRQADFALLQATLSGEKQAPLSYLLFDVLHLDGIDVAPAPLSERKKLLEDLLRHAPHPLVYSSHVQGNGAGVFKAAAEQGLEGIVSKRADAPHRDGRSDSWRKSKQLASDEFAVVGFTPPKGSRAGFGALLLARPDTNHGWRYAGRVGSGFSDRQLTALAKQLDRNSQSEPTVHVPPHDTDLRAARWIQPAIVVEAFFRGVGSEGLLRQPSLKAVRTDKSVDDLRDSDRGGEPAPTAPDPRNDMRLTHPERVVYPDRGITKGDVADYYIAVMAWLLPEVINRPLSIIRCTEGIEKACFFQKHHTAGLSLVDAVSIKEESGERAAYLVVRDAESLMELVQFNAIEFHPWGATAEQPELADRIVFDLDPGPDVAWPDIVAAARRIRSLLEELSLTSFLRTSGGKGLHVVVPLNPGCPWSTVKPFARALAESLATGEPSRYLATATKSLRKGRIFVDYLRNGRGATSVASYSLRARAGAPVAVPLSWEELSRVKRADAFDIESLPARLAKLRADPWEGIDEVKQDLDSISALLNQKA